MRLGAGCVDFSFSVDRADYPEAMELARQAAANLGAEDVLNGRRGRALGRRRRHALAPGSPAMFSRPQPLIDKCAHGLDFQNQDFRARGR